MKTTKYGIHRHETQLTPTINDELPIRRVMGLDAQGPAIRNNYTQASTRIPNPYHTVVVWSMLLLFSSTERPRYFLFKLPLQHHYLCGIIVNNKSMQSNDSVAIRWPRIYFCGPLKEEGSVTIQVCFLKK